MDITNRYITKISREAQRYARLSLQGTDLGTSEYECLHFIRKNKGVSQEKLSTFLNIDKAAVARMVANLEKKGYLYRLQDENDKRAKKLFVTDKVINIKNITSSGESNFYEWLLDDIDEERKKVFINVLNELYIKSKKERRENFTNIKKRDVMNYGKAED
ncbi:MAG: Transcriptional regulator [Clostridiales bacterium]|jgi:DNA-binding MarR family transcriptional regulator|nr:Transcriptional regulator [Clostridiales bacterium]